MQCLVMIVSNMTKNSNKTFGFPSMYSLFTLDFIFAGGFFGWAYWLHFLLVFASITLSTGIMKG